MTRETKEETKVVKKKGNNSWKEVRPLDVVAKTAGKKYRWCKADQQSMLRRLHQGYEIVNDVNGGYAQHVRPNTLNDGKSLSTTVEYQDLVLMSIDEETYETREEWLRDKLDRQLSVIDRNLESQSAGVPIHGSVNISRNITIQD